MQKTVRKFFLVLSRLLDGILRKSFLSFFFRHKPITRTVHEVGVELNEFGNYNIPFSYKEG